jgi:UDP-N-acetylenolpyruvoylglucosamine reductase
MDKLLRELELLFGEQRLNIKEPLSQYLPNASIHPDLVLSVNTTEELTQVVSLARRYHVSFGIIDSDFDGEKSVELIIRNNTRRYSVLARKGKIQSQKMIMDFALVEAESGVPFNQLVRFCIDEGLGGVEEGLGLTGSVGYVIKRRGEYVESLQKNDIIQTLKVLDEKNELKEIQLSDMKKDLLVLSVVFKLFGESTKILWLKAQKAAEKRGIHDYKV